MNLWRWWRQLRIHLRWCWETSKHNHQRSFITMCIQGGYEYRYYKFVEEVNSEIEIWNRVNGEFELVKRKKEPFDSQSQCRGYSRHSPFSREDIPHIFDTDSKPLYVDHSWFLPFIQRIRWSSNYSPDTRKRKTRLDWIHKGTEW